MFDADALAETLLNGKPQLEYTIGKDPSITFKVHRIEYMGSNLFTIEGIINKSKNFEKLSYSKDFKLDKNSDKSLREQEEKLLLEFMQTLYDITEIVYE